MGGLPSNLITALSSLNPSKFVRGQNQATNVFLNTLYAYLCVNLLFQNYLSYMLIKFKKYFFLYPLV